MPVTEHEESNIRKIHQNKNIYDNLLGNNSTTRGINDNFLQ